MRGSIITIAVLSAALLTATSSYAGKVFLTGHDPDFHAQQTATGKALLSTALNYVTSGTYNGGITKFLFIEANISPPANHLDGEGGLTAIGLVNGVDYTRIDAAGFAALTNFSGYSAIVVASDFGGLTTDAEIQELTARKTDIASFVNAGGGLAAFAECGVGYSDCVSDLVNAATPLFGFVPVGVSSVDTSAPYTVTAFGASLGLTDADVNDPTHNSFASAAGLNIVDNDTAGVPTTLAGDVSIGGSGFGTPEPATWAMMLLGVGAIGGVMRRRQRTLKSPASRAV